MAGGSDLEKTASLRARQLLLHLINKVNHSLGFWGFGVLGFWG